MDTPSDRFLMERVQDGDHAQLALLFERYHVGLFRYVMSLTRNRCLSEDLVQEVFVRVLKYARSYDPSSSFPAWIYGIARNVYFDSLQRRRAEVVSNALADISSGELLPEEAIARKQDTAFLEEALQQLPEDKREVLILSRFHGLRYEEIARILECEVGAVKVRVYRAMKELRSKFCALRGGKLYEV